MIDTAIHQEVPRFSLAERERRWERVRTMMDQYGIDVIYVAPNTGFFDQFQANARYLTGIGGNNAQVAAIFPRSGEVTAVTSPDIAVPFWLGRQDWVSDIRPIGSGWGYIETSIERLRELGVDGGTIGISGLAGNTRFPEGIVSHGMMQRLQDAFPQARFVNANVLMERTRFVKSDEELAFMERADELVEAALDVLKREARPGVPECVVYARMLASMIEAGGELPTMILWSAGWPQPPSNYYMPTQRPLQSGDMISMEIEARWGGYIAQNTQPAFLGPVPDEYLRMFDRQQNALHACYDMLHSGVTLGQIVDTCASFGTEEYSCQIIMHARGLGDDSPMAVYQTRDDLMRDWPIENNSTFIIKPVITRRAPWARLYWGDTVVATERGARRLGRRAPEIYSLSARGECSSPNQC